MSSPPARRHHPVTLQQAAEESPTLAALANLARESGERLQAVQSLIPQPLRPSVQAGPITGADWCLLVRGNAAAAKMRQLLPTLAARLREKGWAVETIRLKVHH